MLSQRVITAAVLLPLFVAAVWYLPTPWFGVLAGMIVCLGAWEWSGLAGLSSFRLRLPFVGLVAVLLAVVYELKANVWSQLLLFSAVAGWFLVAVLILSVEKRVVVIPASRMVRAMLGVLVLVPSWLGLILLHAGGPDSRVILLFLVALIAAADIAAYFSGRRWGSHRLAPVISPGKTREGLWGALAGALPVALGYALIDNIQGIELLVFLILCLVTVLFSVAGDLLESLIKRSAGRKDSGTLLPGHGGVLDRIDSLTGAVPVFVTGLLLWSIFL